MDSYGTHFVMLENASPGSSQIWLNSTSEVKLAEFSEIDEIA